MNRRSSRAGTLGVAPPIRLDQAVNRVLIRLGGIAVLALVVAMIANVWRTELYSRVDANTAANQALAVTDTGMLDEEVALRAFVGTQEPAFAAAHAQGRREVQDGDAVVEQFVSDDPPLLSQYVSVRLAQDGWETGWAQPALLPQPPAGMDAFFARGSILFGTYRDAESQLSTTLTARVNLAEASAQWAAVVELAVEGALLLVAVLLWWRGQRRLRRYVLGPVSTILAGIKRIEGGDYGPPVQLARGPSELRAVSEQLAAVAGTLESARTGMREREEEAEHHAARLRRIVDMGREIAGSLNLHYVLQAVSDSVLGVGHFRRCVIWLTDEANASLLPLHDSAGVKGRVEGLTAITVGEQAVGKAARFGRIVGPQEVSHPHAPAPWSRAIAIPMIVGARVVGVIEIGLDGVEEVPLPVMELVETLSSQAATAIEAARLYELAELRGKTDALTLLPNRRDLDRALGVEVARAQRYSRPLAVAMVDIDHFKAVNDTEGHLRGDEILQETAAVMRGVLRSIDTIYRYGGEEFLVVMPETDSVAALDLCNRLRVAVAERVTVRSGLMLTVSCGVASFPGGGRDPAGLIASADGAMDTAKRGGRNQVVAAAVTPLVRAMPDARSEPLPA